MIEHVYRRAAASPAIDAVLVATDDQRVCDAVEAFGGAAVMTRADHRSGRVNPTLWDPRRVMRNRFDQVSDRRFTDETKHERCNRDSQLRTGELNTQFFHRCKCTHR